MDEAIVRWVRLNNNGILNRRKKSQLKLEIEMPLLKK
jgi:hypothetical protein